MEWAEPLVALPGLFPPRVEKPIGNPEFISIFVPTRARPAFLADLLDSLEETTRRKNFLDVWVYVDDDDRVTEQYLRDLPSGTFGFAVHGVVGPPPVSQGEMYNALRRVCTSDPGIYMFGFDKTVFLNHAWDDEVREAFDRYPDRLLFAFPVDSFHGAHFGACGFVSAEALNLLGRFFLEMFPYWFDDSWFNQVFMLIGRRERLCMPVYLQEGRGKTMRMRNLAFWRKFFEVLLPERLAEAAKLGAALGKASPGEKQREEEGRRITRRILRARQSVEHLRRQEGKFSQTESKSFADDPRYVLIEKRALRYLVQRLEKSLQERKWTETNEIGEVIALACHQLPGFEVARAEWAAAAKTGVGDPSRDKERLLGYLNFLGEEPERRCQYRIKTIPPGSADHSRNHDSSRWSRCRKAFRRLFLKRYVKLAFLELVNKLVPDFERYYGLDPYPPEGFPFLTKEWEFLKRMLWRNTRPR